MKRACRLGVSAIRRQLWARGVGAVFGLVMVGTAGCVSANSTRVDAPETPPASAVAECPAPLEPYVKVTLYMGRGSRDPAVWQTFTDEVLVKHFPDGGTMIETSGWWEGRVGDATEKNSRMLVMLHPAADRTAFATAVEVVIADIKQRFGHRAVLWEEVGICATLSS